MTTLPSSTTDRIAAWAQHVRHTRALRLVLERFGGAQILALPVKGIVSAKVLYEDVADRLLTDVDLKIRPQDFDRVLALCRREGWREVQRMRAYRNVVFVVEGVCVDVEGYPNPPGLSCLTVDTMLERASPSRILGFPHLLPDFHDHAVLLLINLFKDKLVHAFVWSVKDVERLPTHPAFAREQLVERLRQSGVSTIGWVVADWMVENRGIEAWRPVRDAIGPRPPRATYVALLRRLRAIQPRGTLALRIVTRAGADHRADRAHALFRMMWWQVEAWASRWGDAPFVRQDPAQLSGTVTEEARKVSG
jgi:hypothetical protein